MAASSNYGDDDDVRTAFRVAVCATIVHNFPHEALWMKGMEGTGGTIIAAMSGHWNRGVRDENARDQRSAAADATAGRPWRSALRADGTRVWRCGRAARRVRGGGGPPP